ncbi:ATP-binding protein [Kitasatospora purpeofusca]|uniref:sensor histidine kinase n=1 Tax=Kitasatospora purpeofusca TaxID=67352 RepID=UPI002250909C|nr:ATP-binding protein [Kitasatospora purpeofusca]MCX4688049.1 ATP-binding protein [Kitasatospora purpeofusca]
MTETTSPDGGPSRRPDVRTRAVVAAAALLAAVAGPVGVMRAFDAGRPLTAAAVAAVTVLWLIAVRQAGSATERARRLELELGRWEGESMTALVVAGAARQGEVAAKARATAAEAERDEARAALARAEEDAAAARAEAAGARAQAEAERAERAAVDRLADEVLPVLVKRLRSGATVDAALAPHRDHPQRPLLRAVAEEIGRGERLRAAALAVCATAAGRVQALATSMHAELREMQHRHDEEVLGDLLRLDHSTAQAGRMADSIAVLTGARSGRRWGRPIPVESVLRGALGRIGAYQRVRLHNASTAAVAGFAAEGVMHALAELLDNATTFSAPPAEVHVYVEEVPAGLVVTVEDSGLGLSDSWLRRAERAVSAESLDLTTLSAGTRIGLAVVGVLARKHGLQISFRPSARGGTGVVVLIPQQLVTYPETMPAPLPAPAERVVARAAGTGPRPALTPARPAPAVPVAPAAPVAGAESVPVAPAVTDSGLPQRRRGRTMAAASPAAAPVERPARPDGASAAARLGAFRRAALPAAEAPNAEPAATAGPAVGTPKPAPAGAPAPAEGAVPVQDIPGARSAADPASDASPVTEKDFR